MRNAMATLLVALTLAGGNLQLKAEDKDPPSTPPARVYKIGGQNGIQSSRNGNRIVVGDSYSVRISNLRSTGSRDLVGRNQGTERGGSFTGSGSDIRVVGYSYEQCVIYFKRQTGIQRSLGYAGNIRPQGQEAKIGSGALERGHISLVIGVNENSIRVREANYYRGKITERTIPKSKIRGYIYR